MRRGGCICDYHSVHFLPELLFDLIVVLSAEKSYLYPRLKKRYFFSLCALPRLIAKTTRSACMLYFSSWLIVSFNLLQRRAAPRCRRNCQSRKSGALLAQCARGIRRALDSATRVQRFGRNRKECGFHRSGSRLVSFFLRPTLFINDLFFTDKSGVTRIRKAA